ncbi:MAG: tetratricopeptide repeat protein [Promethearchaeota archaeon]
MDNDFNEKYDYFQKLALHDYLQAELEINTYLKNPLLEIQRLKLQVELANCLWLNSKMEEAESLYLEILSMSDLPEFLKEKAEALVGLGTIDNDSGRFEIAANRTQQGIAILHNLDHPDREAYALNRLGIIRYSQGELDEAKRIFLKVVKLVENLDEIVNLKAMNNIALIDEERGNIESATKKYEFCHKKAKELKYNRGILIMGKNYAGSLQIIGEYSKAKEVFEETLHFAEKVGDIRNIALICQSYASFCTDLGEFNRAEHLFEQSMVFYEEIEDKLSHIMMLENYADLWLRLGDMKTAKKLLLEALGIIEKSGLREPEISILTTLAEIYHRENNTKEAYSILKRANEFAWKQKSDVSRARVLLERARINMSQVNLWEAGLLLSETQRLAEKSKHLELRFKTLIFLAELGLLQYKKNQQNDKYYEDSIRYITKAMELATEKKLIPDYINAGIVRAMLHTVKYEFEEAEELLEEIMALAESRGISQQTQRAKERLNFIIDNIQSLKDTQKSDNILFSITIEEIQQIISRYTGKSTIQEDVDNIFIVSYKMDSVRGPKIHAIDNIDVSDPRYMQQINLVGSLYPVSLGKGHKLHTGLFGPFPFGTANLKALVYSMVIAEPTPQQSKAKIGDTTFFLICIIYPEKMSPFFYDQKKLEALIEMNLSEIQDLKEINQVYLHDLRKHIIEEMSEQVT